MIVSREPPDPISDPRVEDLMTEVNDELEEANRLAKNYVVGERFNYYSEKVNVDDMDDEDDSVDGQNDGDDNVDGDNDSDRDDHGDNDVNEDIDTVVLPINVQKKTKMTKQKVQEERNWIREGKKMICRIAVEAWENGEHGSINACAKYYNLDPQTLRKLISTGED